MHMNRQSSNSGAPSALDRYRDIVPGFEDYVACSATPLDRTFRVNSIRSSHAQIDFWLQSISREIQNIPWLGDAYRLNGRGSFGFLAGYIAGLFHLQESASMAPVRVLAPRPGDRVLDLCAAPGNKTAQLSEAVGRSGVVVANDISRQRLGVVRTTMDRLGLTNVHVTALDGTDIPPNAGCFDAVLADVPCSCEGTSRLNAGVLSRTGPESRRQLAHRQRKLLEAAMRSCRPGGKVVYATCTYAPEECEAVVSDVLNGTAIGRAFSMRPARLPGLVTRPGLRGFRNRTFVADMPMAMRVWPHENDSGGFFVALLQREEAAAAEYAADPKPSATGGFPALSDLLASDREYFAIPEEAFRDFRLAERGSRRPAAVSGCRVALPQAGQLGAGVRAVNRKGVRARLSTAGLMLFGHTARRHVVDLDLDDLKSYLIGNPTGLRTPLLRQVRRKSVDRGIARIVRCAGLAFGRGELVQDTEGLMLRGRFPRIWAGVDVAKRITSGEETEA
jgi:16S rRNA C967 or C1407 C5-methylase (RsmB/RsmF family)